MKISSANGITQQVVAQLGQQAVGFLEFGQQPVAQLQLLSAEELLKCSEDEL